MNKYTKRFYISFIFFFASLFTFLMAIMSHLNGVLDMALYYATISIPSILIANVLMKGSVKK